MTPVLDVRDPSRRRYGRSATARPAATVRRSASSRRGRDGAAVSTGRRSSSAEALGEPGDLDARAGQDRAVDRLGALLHAVEVQRVAHGVGDLVHALLEHRAGGGDELGVALDLVERA